jgi:hypothetical protein
VLSLAWQVRGLVLGSCAILPGHIGADLVRLSRGYLSCVATFPVVLLTRTDATGITRTSTVVYFIGERDG